MSLDVDLRVELGGLRLDAQLHAAAGETVVVVGPNGAGKTTLLRALAGLLPADGRIVLDGDDITAVPAEARSVGYVFQDHALFPHLSARDNVAFGLRCRGRSRRDARVVADRWLARVGLAEHAAARPGELSGGQAQRVALARALAVEPRLLLLDEPLSALDATTRAVTRRDLVRHLADHDGVRVVVTHDPLDALAMADHLVVLEAGRVVQAGSAEEIRVRPRSRYVADLIGVNLLRGHAERGVVRVRDDAVVVSADEVDGAVFVVFHPHAVALHRARPEGTPRNVWPGTVAALDLDGGRVRVTLEGPVRLSADVTPAAVTALGLAPGVGVWASVKATEVAVYAE
ncbi:MAG TPA: ABC transporter ATP-binding protein [Acidimicrobiales bacterium]|nr:ABC transporter ATP-binding protein [Acidimicrobiales bacterium]